MNCRNPLLIVSALSTAVYLIGCIPNQVEQIDHEEKASARVRSQLCQPVTVKTKINRGGLITDIGTSVSGSVWVTGIKTTSGGYHIYYWSGSNWPGFSGGATSIDVANDGTPWVSNSSGMVFYRNGSGWTRRTDFPYARTIAVGEPGLYAIISSEGYPTDCHSNPAYCVQRIGAGKARNVSLVNGRTMIFTSEEGDAYFMNGVPDGLSSGLKARDISGTSDGFIFISSGDNDSETVYYRNNFNQNQGHCWELIVNSSGIPEFGSSRIDAVSGNELWIQYADKSVRTLRL